MPELGDGESRFITKGVENNYRIDGRKNNEYRQTSLELGLLKNCNGSAHLKLGDTEILVGVKAEISTPGNLHPNEGFLEFFIQNSAHLSYISDLKNIDEFCEESELLFSDIYNNFGFDKTSLCILNKEFCWKLFIEILIVEFSGNIYDAMSFAIKGALHDTKIPIVDVRKDEDTGKYFVELSEKPSDEFSLNSINLPIIVTTSKIGSSHVVDACFEEENCSIASLLSAITPEGNIVFSKKIGGGSLNPFSLQDMMKSSTEIGMEVNKKLSELLKKSFIQFS